MTPEQKQFLINVLSQISVKAVEKESVKVVEMVQSIMTVLTTE